MGWLKDWWNAPDREQKTVQWEVAGQEYRQQLDAAQQAEVEDAKERGLLDGIQLAQSYLRVSLRSYPQGTSSRADVSRETLLELDGVLQGVYLRAQQAQTTRSLKRTAKLLKDLEQST